MSVKKGSGKSGSGKTIALLILVVAAIGFVGYYGFIETGVRKSKAGPVRSMGAPPMTPSVSPSVSPSASPEATPLPART